MARAVQVLCAVLLAGTLSGCMGLGQSVSGRVDALEKAVGETQASVKAASGEVKKMQRTVEDLRTVLTAENKAVAKKLGDRAGTLEAALSSLQSAQKTAAENLKKAELALAALTKASDTRNEESGARIDKVQADVAAVRKDLGPAKAEIARFSAEFKKMSSTIADAQALMIKNLENARDIYKTQFLATEEVLQSMKKGPKTGATTPK